MREILPPFRCNSPAFQTHFVALSTDFLSHIECSSWQFKASVPYPGWVRRGREPSTLRRALSCLNDIATRERFLAIPNKSNTHASFGAVATMSASYLALSCREHVLPLTTTTKLPAPWPPSTCPRGQIHSLAAVSRLPAAPLRPSGRRWKTCFRRSAEKRRYAPFGSRRAERE